MVISYNKKHWFDKIVKTKIFTKVQNEFWFFDLQFVIKSRFCYCRLSLFVKINNFKLSIFKYKLLFMHSNAFFQHFDYVVIVFWLNTVKYEIIFMFVLYWIFLKKYKKSGPKYKERLPYINFRRSSYCNETLV